MKFSVWGARNERNHHSRPHTSARGVASRRVDVRATRVGVRTASSSLLVARGRVVVVVVVAIVMRLDDVVVFDDDDDDLFAAVDVDAVAAASRTALASSTEWNRASRPTVASREGGCGTTTTRRLDDVPLRARADAMRREASGGGRERENGQLTVTSMFAAARGERARPTTVVGEVRETMATTTAAAAGGGGEDAAKKRPRVKMHAPSGGERRKHQSTLPKELMIRKTNDSKELEALRTNLPPEALGERDGRGLTTCASAGGPAGLPMDPEAIQTYVYPAQISRREYQYEMTRNALLTNSLVCLPTGLGKTLIAAVVMYNYYRWFPTGKIIFMAPTRPLVDQQMSACHNVVGIPASDTLVLMGNTKKDDEGSRRAFWSEKRVFFCTPHTVANDLANGTLDADQIVCVVVDEAHHARGQYASAEVLRHLHERKVKFRLLALTATPGQGVEEVQNVVTTLRIGRIDFRSDQDPDVSRYTHKREMTVEKVRPDQAMSHVQDMLCDLLRPYCEKLLRMGALGEAGWRMQTFINNKATHGASRIEPPGWFALHSARTNLNSNPNVRIKGTAYVALDAAMELAKAYDLLLKMGVKQAYDYVEQRGQEKRTTLIHRIDPVSKEVVDLMRSMSTNGAHHSPKLDRLTSILKKHFKDATADTRVIIFTSYRESVKDIVRVLREVPAGADTACKIKVAEFVGQGDSTSGKKRATGGGRSTKGQTQKEQKQTLDDFRAGNLNTLVATSIGEEGLDIPSVDLIFFFDVVDIIRGVQRMGRTGRARDGKVVVLATEGKEYAKFTSEQKKYETLMTCLRAPGNNFKFEKCPRIVPEGVTPVCQLAMIEPSPAEKKKSKPKTNDPAKAKKTRGTKAILNAANKLKDAPLDVASKAILFAYEYDGDALEELNVEAAAPFLSRPNPVHSVEHSDLSRALIDIMADLQGLSRVDSTGPAIPGGLCEEKRAHHTRSPEPARDEREENVAQDVVEMQAAPQFDEADFDDGWGEDWVNPSQDLPMYEANVKTSQEVMEEFTQMSDPVPRRISMHSASPAPRPPAVAASPQFNEPSSVRQPRLSKSSDEVNEDERQKTQDRLSMPPPPPRLTPQSAVAANDATPSTDESEIHRRPRHFGRVQACVLMSQDVSPPVEPPNPVDDDVAVIEDDDVVELPRRQRRARAQPEFNPRKRRNFFVDDEADASDEENEGDSENEMSSGDERFIAHTQGDAGEQHPGARFEEATPEDAQRPRRDHQGNAREQVDLSRTFAAFGPREHRVVQDTPSPTQGFDGSRPTHSSSRYDSSFIDDGSDASLEDSVKRPERPAMHDDDAVVDLSEPDLAHAVQTVDDMWGDVGDEIEDWDDDGWGRAGDVTAPANGGGDIGGDDDDDDDDDDW